MEIWIVPFSLGDARFLNYVPVFTEMIEKWKYADKTYDKNFNYFKSVPWFKKKMISKIRQKHKNSKFHFPLKRLEKETMLES